MSNQFIEIFDSVENLSTEQTGYAVIPIPEHSNYFVGKDMNSFACFLIATRNSAGRPNPPIRLENLDVYFELNCKLTLEDKREQEGIFSIFRCRDSDPEITRYFLSICEALLLALGKQPTGTQVSKAVTHLVNIFQQLQTPSVRSLNGLFGELYLIYRSKDAVKALSAWRNSDDEKFDFSFSNVRLDVKTFKGGFRNHTFSYEQCNPPIDSIAIVASLQAKFIAGGVSIESLIQQISTRVSSNADLVIKLQEGVAKTLGSSLKESLQQHYDLKLADTTLRFFSLREVPAIRGPLPNEVSGVRFDSDLNASSPQSIDNLIKQNHELKNLLPATER